MNKENNVLEMLNQIQASEGEGFVFEEAALLAEYQKGSAEQSSLAIKVLSILGGFLASIAFLSFLLVAGLYNSDMGMLLFGGVFIAGAIWVNKQYDKLIIDTSSISIFVIGLVMLGLGCSKLDMDDNLISLLYIAIALGTLVLTQNFMLSFISVLVISGSVLALILSNEGYDLVHLFISALAVGLTGLFLNEAKMLTAGKKMSRLYNPVRTGLVFSFLISLAFFGKKDLIPVSPHYTWLSSVVTIAMVLYLVYLLCKIMDVKSGRDQMVIYALSFLLLLPTAMSPAISGALLIVLLSFLVHYKTGLALSIIAFVYFISQFYYDLRFTLLVKSGILFSSGILFILFYLYLHKKTATHEKV